MARGTGGGTAVLPTGVRVAANGKGYEIRWKIAGRAYSETITVPLSRAAALKAAKIRQARIDALRLGVVVPAESSETFTAAAQRYLDRFRGKPSTRSSYRSALNTWWMPDLEHMPVNAIRYRHLAEIDEKAKWPSTKTRNNAIGPLRGVFEMLVRDDLLDASPATKLRIQRRQKPEIDPFTAEEKAAILKKLDGVALAYFGLAFETGARTGELLALQWDRVDVRKGEMFIDQARVRGDLTSTKTHRARRVLLTEAARTYLLSLESIWKRGAVFLAPQTGQPYQSAHHLNERWIAACKAAGVRHRRAYNCRHTRATLGLMAGQAPAFLAAQLGHSVAMLLSTYARWLPGDRDREEMLKLEPIPPVTTEKVG